MAFMLYPVAIFNSCVCSRNCFFKSSAMASMLQSAFVAALRHRSATDPDGVTKEISAMLAHLYGGVSAADVRKRRRVLVTEAAAKTTSTSSLVSDMVNDPALGFEKNKIPTTKQISSKRSRTLATANASTPGESPDELRNLARSMIRQNLLQPLFGLIGRTRISQQRRRAFRSHAIGCCKHLRSS